MTNAIFNPIGNPPPTIHWSKLRSPLPWQHRVEGNTLVIPRVAQQDSGQYICNATNTAGHAEATVVLHVESKSSLPSPDFCLWCTGLYVPLPSSSLGRIPIYLEDSKACSGGHPCLLLGPTGLTALRGSSYRL